MLAAPRAFHECNVEGLNSTEGLVFSMRLLLTGTLERLLSLSLPGQFQELVVT